ncbi:MAG: hypothetical protein ACR2MG_04805 [Pyrinomonadaceae bacterium]
MSEPYLHLDDSILNIGTLNSHKRMRLSRSKLLDFGSSRKDKHKQIMSWLKAEYQRGQNARDQAAWIAGKSERIEKVKHAINFQIQIHLGAWVEKVDEAVNSASESEEKNSIAYWFIALAGNLVWAATSLKSVADSAKIILSFVGAAVGSGSVEKFRDHMVDTPENRKDFIKGEIAKLQVELDENYQSKRSEWADELDSDPKTRVAGDKFDDYLKEFVWNKMFQIKFGKNHQFEVFTKAKTNIETLLNKLKKEWESWKDTQKPLDTISDGLGPRYVIKNPNAGKPFDPDLRGEYMQMVAMVK